MRFVTGEHHEKIKHLLDEILKKVGKGENHSPLDPKATIKTLQIVLKGRFPYIDLIHRLFIPPEKHLELARKWNDSRGRGFTDQDFEKLGEAPSCGQRIL